MLRFIPLKSVSAMVRIYPLILTQNYKKLVENVQNLADYLGVDKLYAVEVVCVCRPSTMLRDAGFERVLVKLEELKAMCKGIEVW